jgi:transcriptional regulator of heat shock response
MTDEQEFDVVIDALQQRIDSLWKMTQGNMNMGMMNMMDDIRLEQIDTLREAIKLWENRNEV